MAEKKRIRKIPDNYTWFKVSHPDIPTKSGTYRIAALHEDQATTAISRKFNIRVYVDDENTEINKIGPVSVKQKKDINKIEAEIEKIIYDELDDFIDIEETTGPLEEKKCINCGYLDLSIGADHCPMCGAGYPESWYCIADNHIRGEL